MTKGYKILKVSKKLKKRRRVQFDNDRSFKTEYIFFVNYSAFRGPGKSCFDHPQI